MRPQKWWHPYALLAPSLSLLTIFFLLPVAAAALASLFRWDMLTRPSFVGAAHYKHLVGSGELAQLFLNSLGYSLAVVAGAMSLGLSLALLVNRPGKLFAFVRASIFSAYIVSWVAVSLLWLWLLDADGGFVGQWAKAAGIAPFGLLNEQSTALWALAGVSVWKISGYAMMLFLVGLQDIPNSLLEAAALDGASGMGRFRHIIWPLLRPTAAFVATTSLILSFQAFDVVRVMTQGGPANRTTLFVYAIYEQIFMDLRVGRASAISMVFFVLLLGLSGLQLWAWRSQKKAVA